MDDKMIAVIFDNEKNAYDGAKALKELHTEGSITLYASAVIAKDASGNVNIKQLDDRGPIGTGLGLVTGTLIGLLGGPVGAAIGAGAGTFGGMIYDFAKVGVGEDFVEEVAQRMKLGKVAVVGEVREEWVTPLDTRMEAVGGVVIRRMRDEVLDSQIEKEAAALKLEIADLKAEHALARQESKAKLEAKINAANARLQEIRDRAKMAREETEKEMGAKIDTLKQQVAEAKGDAKTKLETRLAEVQTDHKQRTQKLRRAWEITKDALS